VSERATAAPAQTGGLLAKAADVLRRTGEPVWLTERREAAWQAFNRLPQPQEVYPEEWRRTDISGLDLDGFTPVRRSPGATAAAAPEEFAAFSGTDADRAGLLIHVDGAYTARGLSDEARRRGVLFMDLSDAATSHPDLVREHLFSTLGDEFDRHRFRALHAALLSTGTLVHIPKGVEVALPFVAQTWLGVPGGAVFPHTLIVADEGSKGTLVDVYASTASGARTFACGMTELVLRPGSQFRYVMSQEWGAPMWEAGSLIRARVERDATLNGLVVALGGSLVKFDVESQLIGAGASSEMLGLYFGAGRQHIDIHTLQQHRAPSTFSDLLYKGAVKDTAHSVFAGLIRVDWGAQKTNAFQANRNLILSEGARSDSIPKLEIMANDLRCTHGSATSRLNEEHIFYLMSRGLSRDQATRLIVEGFLADVFDRIPLERVRAHVEQAITEKLR
jgi:Fe-S cluster assembly protein SufD